VLPLRQHAGKPARLLVKRGDRVERGDKIAEADGFVSVPIHASAAGTVTGVDWWPHPDGSMAEAVRIRVEKYSPQIPRPRMVPRWEGLSPAQVIEAVQRGGVVGLGGAAFPAHVKLAPPEDVKIELLVVNGAECEPYLTTDHRTMVEFPGARALRRADHDAHARREPRRDRRRAQQAGRDRRAAGHHPGGPGRHGPPAHGEISAGRGKDADPRRNRKGGAVREAPHARGRGGTERRLHRLHRRDLRDRPPADRAGSDGERARREAAFQPHHPGRQQAGGRDSSSAAA
jgi:hypothetical protein